MPRPSFLRSLLRLLVRWLLPPAAALLLNACGGGGSGEPAPTEPDSLIATTVAGFPHDVDIYRTAGATRALVLLHGGGGNKSSIAYQLGLNSDPQRTSADTVNWAWLRAQRLMLVVPQGQSLDSEPNARTWSNHAMLSGQDDKAFLQALALRIRGDYGISQLTLVGHSMGGVMANRLWCEAPSSFDAYVSLAGPASAEFTRPDLPCTPGTGIKPYLGVIGDEDEVMQNAGLWEAARWTVNPVWVQASVRAWHNDEVIGELQQQRARAALMCGETLQASAFTAAGPVDTWRSCAGRLQLKRVRGAGHAASALDEHMGTASTLDLMDTVMAFITGL